MEQNQNAECATPALDAKAMAQARTVKTGFVA